ncbi:MAG: hypothetical protein ACOX6V_05405 [Patescibacteria group bacterium]|jgi:hypothetical protein
MKNNCKFSILRVIAAVLLVILLFFLTFLIGYTLEFKYHRNDSKYYCKVDKYFFLGDHYFGRSCVCLGTVIQDPTLILDAPYGYFCEGFGLSFQNPLNLPHLYPGKMAELEEKLEMFTSN